MFSADLTRAVAREARAMRVEPAALMAVVQVESAGHVTARVDGRDEPLIRFEGHYFHRLLSGAKRREAVRRKLASPSAGAIRNPSSQTARWRMLERARLIDRAAADQSASWGIGQVMGANWRTLGYGSVAELVREARSGPAGQLRLMVRFIHRNRLDGALRDRDWAAFARAYNGPAYAKHGYHTAMAKAYSRHVRAGANAVETEGAGAVAPEPVAAAPERSRWFDVSGDRPTLARWARGEAVRRVQRILNLRPDGLFGPSTEAAVRRFQSRQGLRPDGMIGPRSWDAIERREDTARMRAFLLAPWRWLRRLLHREATA